MLGTVMSVVPQGLRCTPVTPDTGWQPLHTAWMPQPCRWAPLELHAASMQYGPVLEGRAWRKPVSAAGTGNRRTRTVQDL